MGGGVLQSSWPVGVTVSLPPSIHTIHGALGHSRALSDAIQGREEGQGVPSLPFPRDSNSSDTHKRLGPMELLELPGVNL